MSVTFNSINSGGATGTISAIAVDGDTASAAIEGDRNYHVGARYGLTFLTNFMSGLSTAISANATATTTASSSTGGGTTTTTTSQNDYDWEEYALTGLGAAGTALSTNLSDQLNDVPALTVTIPAGKLIGVLLTSDYKLETS